MENNITTSPKTPLKSVDWNSLGSYFVPVFKTYSQELDYVNIYNKATSEKRFDNLTERFNKISKEYKIDAHKMCLPANEAWDMTAMRSSTYPRTTLSEEQEIAVSLIEYMDDTKEGGKIIVSAYGSNVIICAINGDPDTNGFYDNALNMATFDLHAEKWDEASNKTITTDVTNTIFNNANIFGAALHTLSEEMAHARQWDKNISFAPAVSKDNMRYSRPDEKLWYLMVEAHAKISAASILVHAAMGKKRENGTFTEGTPSLLNSFLRDVSPGHDSAIVRAVLQAHMRHGHDAIQKDSSLLWPAYKAFFENGGGSSYYKNHRDIINEKIDSKDYDRIDMRHIIEAFGQLPGMEGNALEKPLAGKTPEDIVGLLPEESKMAQWFKQSFQAMAEGKPIPDLKPERSDPKPQPAEELSVP